MYFLYIIIMTRISLNYLTIIMHKYKITTFCNELRKNHHRVTINVLHINYLVSFLLRHCEFIMSRNMHVQRLNLMLMLPTPFETRPNRRVNFSTGWTAASSMRHQRYLVPLLHIYPQAHIHGRLQTHMHGRLQTPMHGRLRTHMHGRLQTHIQGRLQIHKSVNVIITVLT